MVSLAAPIDAIIRREYVYPDRDNPSQIIPGQQVNYLDQLSDIFTVKNGYIIKNTSSKVLPGDIENAMKLVKVMYNESAVVYNKVVYNKIPPILEMEDIKPPFPIHQVFTAAMNIVQGDSGLDNRLTTYDETGNRTQQQGLKEKLYFLLEAAYTSAYLSAHLCKAPVLWLTMVGGGAFGNFFDYIVDVINIVHQKYGGNIKVHLVDFDQYVAQDVKSGKLVVSESCKNQAINKHSIKIRLSPEFLTANGIEVYEI
jgi:hypothetical protein